ncbi:MAG: TIGR01841 family phasin [Pseudomonadota bacterium]|nr:TIGR01841 family phasin [Pseudomonadota bacterium]
MSNEILNNVTEQFKPVVASARELNQLAVASLEKVVKLQLASLQSYTDLVIANLKAAVEVQDVEGLKDYLTRQGELAKAVGEKLVQDAKDLTEVGNQFNADATRIVQNSVNAVAKQAA